MRHLKHFLGKINWLAESLDAQIAWIGTGDYVDLISPSNRERYRSSGLYTPARRVISDATHNIVSELHGILKEFIRGRDIVTLCYGHHWFIYDDTFELPYPDTDRHLAAEFGLAKRDDRGVCRGAGIVDFIFPKTKSKYRVFFQHGEGNGQTLTYGLNKLDRIAGGWETVDAFFMGHTHKVGTAKKARLSIEDDEIVHRDIRLVTSGAFLKGWKLNEVLYPEEKQLAPIPLGGAAVLVEPDDEMPTKLSSIALEF